MSGSGEVIQIHVGQAGVQMASACWELYCLEHGITADGYLTGPDPGFSALFGCSQAGKVVPRVVLIDLEPTPIDEIRTGYYRHLFHPRTLISGKEEGASNFARSYFTRGEEIIGVTMETIRKVAEICDNLRGVCMFRAIGGGTGGGLGTLILEELIEGIGKTSTYEFQIFPSPRLSPVVVEPYNAVLASHFSTQFSDCTILFDNEALYDICAHRLNVVCPTYTNINRVLAQVMSAITASIRFDGSKNIGLNEIRTNLVPFPRIHYPLVSFAPLSPCDVINHEHFTTRDLTRAIFEPSSFMVKCNPHLAKYIACVLLYRGISVAVDAHRAIQELRMPPYIKFVDWAPSGFKTAFNTQPPTAVPGGDIMPALESVCMLSNNTAIKDLWCRLESKFNLMLQSRAFLHHFVGEGIEEGVFNEAKENLCTLIEDYKAVEE